MDVAMTTEIKENTSVLEALDFAVTCTVQHYIPTKDGYKPIITCDQPANFIATLHSFRDCSIIKKPICKHCVKKGSWNGCSNGCNINNRIIDLESL